MGRLLRRHTRPQRPHAVRPRCRARAQPPRRHGGHLTHVGQDVLRHPRRHHGSRDRVAFLVPRHLEQPAQHDRRHAARARQEWRRRHDQLQRGVSQRSVPDGKAAGGRAVATGCRNQAMRRGRGVRNPRLGVDLSRGDEKRSAASRHVGRDRRSYRPRGEDRRRRSRGTGVGLRWLDHAARNGRCFETPENHWRTAEKGLLGAERSEDPGWKPAAGHGTGGTRAGSLPAGTIRPSAAGR